MGSAEILPRKSPGIGLAPWLLARFETRTPGGYREYRKQQRTQSSNSYGTRSTPISERQPLRAAIELDLFYFDRRWSGHRYADLVIRSGASARGIRILCGLPVRRIGLLRKFDRVHISSTATASVFLNRTSPACAGQHGRVPELTEIDGWLREFYGDGENEAQPNSRPEE